MPRFTNALLSPELRWTTIGSIALIFLGAFESLAVTTIMPTISTELDGEQLYSLAFSATLAASIVGTVVSGGWADRRGPSRPLIVAMVVFVIGLILSGTATSMGVFVVGRFLQGLGSGGIIVALYVVVGRLYPAALHPKIFGAFAAAWVLPSMIGPPVAGFVADTISWHWVFLGVGVLVAFAAVFIAPALRQLRSMTTELHPDARIGTTPVWASIVAVAVVAVGLGGELFARTEVNEHVARWAVALVALAVIVVAARPLLPRGTLLVRRGLPATVLLRGAAAAAFFGTEVYLPYLLHERYGLPSWASGLILTVGAVSWALGSAVQSRLGERMSHDQTLRLGAGVLVLGIVTQFVTAALMLSPLVAAGGWFFAGAGMGLLYPRISTLVLSFSNERNQGFNSAAMSISDNVGGATSIAFAGLLFTAFGGVVGGNGFVAALALTSALAVLVVPVAMRVRAPRE
jgi:MFS family permease